VPRRILVVGLDCAPPSLVFERWRGSMPNVSRLMEAGTWGPLRSCIPPITVPAWTCMVSGRDPGELGLYGFRNRERDGYEMRVATSRDVRHKRVWDWLSEHGRRVAPLFVPLTWPPSPVRGHMASCLLTPGPESPWTFPAALGDALTREHGPYCADVPDFRSDDAERVLRDLHRMADQHFAIAGTVLRDHAPDFLMMVEMGPDRLHHALWHHLDPASSRYRAGNPWEDACRSYYGALDAHLGELLGASGDDTTVLVVSDHGARAMEGGVHVNELLRREGWLARTDDGAIDFARSRAWGEGGYYARIWLNVSGREPLGVVPPERFDEERGALAALLRGIIGPDGAPLENRVLEPERIYRATRGVPPDLLVFFGDLRYRSLGTPSSSVFATANDTGPDGCNHDWDGIFVMSGADAPALGRVEGLQIYDVARTICGLAGIPAPPDLLGTDRST
jgi:predicted AlkP superfamily phosphohydrolase/phosphomutase